MGLLWDGVKRLFTRIGEMPGGYIRGPAAILPVLTAVALMGVYEYVSAGSVSWRLYRTLSVYGGALFLLLLAIDIGMNKLGERL